MPEPIQPTIKQQRDLKQELKAQRRQSQARRERMKSIVTWSVVGLAVVGMIVLVMVSKGGSSESGTLAPVTSDDHIKGSASAPAVLVEYSDYQCPACGAYYPVVKDLAAKYGEKLAVVFRNFPLTSIHPNAQLAAQAAEAAGLQGKYWEMHDQLFENQQTWSAASDIQQTFIDYAKQLGLDEAKFRSDLTSNPVKDRVQRDITSGNTIGINATPTFYLNGEKLTNPAGQAAFEQLIDAALPK